MIDNSFRPPSANSSFYESTTQNPPTQSYPMYYPADATNAIAKNILPEVTNPFFNKFYTVPTVRYVKENNFSQFTPEAVTLVRDLTKTVGQQTLILEQIGNRLDMVYKKLEEMKEESEKTKLELRTLKNKIKKLEKQNKNNETAKTKRKATESSSDKKRKKT